MLQLIKEVEIPVLSVLPFSEIPFKIFVLNKLVT